MKITFYNPNNYNIPPKVESTSPLQSVPSSEKEPLLKTGSLHSDDKNFTTNIRDKYGSKQLIYLGSLVCGFLIIIITLVGLYLKYYAFRFYENPSILCNGRVHDMFIFSLCGYGASTYLVIIFFSCCPAANTPEKMRHLFVMSIFFFFLTLIAWAAPHSTQMTNVGVIVQQNGTMYQCNSMDYNTFQAYPVFFFNDSINHDKYHNSSCKFLSFDTICPYTGTFEKLASSVYYNGSRLLGAFLCMQNDPDGIELCDFYASIPPIVISIWTTLSIVCWCNIIIIMGFIIKMVWFHKLNPSTETKEDLVIDNKESTVIVERSPDDNKTSGMARGFAINEEESTTDEDDNPHS
jgi:hypothetical protein